MAEGTELRRGLGALATIGSTAPFVGLFGTVVGIINSFAEIARTGSGGMETVSAGIAEALVATALGILVAVPAVVLFNYFSSKVEAVEAALASGASAVLDAMRRDGWPTRERPSKRPPRSRVEGKRASSASEVAPRDAAPSDAPSAQGTASDDSGRESGNG